MKPTFAIAVLAALISLGTSCAHRGPAQVTAVNTTLRDRSVQEADQRIFLANRATGTRFQAQPLPPEKQHQEILVSWAGAPVDAVVLEYRQPQRPNQVQHQTVPVTTGYRHTFRIDSAALQAGGPLSAWRVTLLAGGQPVAQKQSALWQ